MDHLNPFGIEGEAQPKFPFRPWRLWIRQFEKWPIRGFTRPPSWDSFGCMSTITAILEAEADGTLHLPVPQNLRQGKVKVVATLQAQHETASQREEAKPGTPLEALKELRKLGGLSHVIPDPVAWQREQRKERLLPGQLSA
jgi:hypothetical protein